MPTRDDVSILEEALHDMTDDRDLAYAILSTLLYQIDNGMEDHGEAFLKAINWREASIDKNQLVLWWNQHKRQEMERRALIQQQIALEDLRKAALAKLTPEERIALGLGG